MPETPILINDERRRLRCLIEGESVVFTVTVPHDFEVGDLKPAIWSERAITLKDVDPHTLELWKPNDSNPIAATPAVTLAERIRSLGNLSECANNLEPPDNLFSMFPNQPPGDHLHIIVRVPATSIRGKRAAPEPAEGLFDRLKRAKIVTNAPSDTGKSAAYECLQAEPSEKILDDRSKPDADIPPIPLIYEGFGHFLDIMDGREDVPGLSDVDVRELRKEVDDLASKIRPRQGTLHRR